MMNAYYLISTDKIQRASQFAREKGLPDYVSLTAVYSNDGSKAIVQVDWPEEGVAWLNENGVFLGELQPDGSAAPAVYEELAKPEWQTPMEEY